MQKVGRNSTGAFICILLLLFLVAACVYKLIDDAASLSDASSQLQQLSGERNVLHLLAQHCSKNTPKSEVVELLQNAKIDAFEKADNQIIADGVTIDFNDHGLYRIVVSDSP